MEVKRVHNFFAACLATYQDTQALATYVTCDGGFMNFSDPLMAVLEEPERVRLVVCQADDESAHISLYLTESVRITSGFLEKMKNYEALAALSVLLENAPQIFANSHSNPVISAAVYEDVIGRQHLQLPRTLLAQAMVARQRDFVESISPSSVSGWEKELAQRLPSKFVGTINAM